uniref:Uncharacterized protein n=1 Tax=Arundo donax TaxID=35708 RepID=A0A0A9BHX0_ARUDO
MVDWLWLALISSSSNLARELVRAKGIRWGSAPCSRVAVPSRNGLCFGFPSTLLAFCLAINKLKKWLSSCSFSTVSIRHLAVR